MMKAGVPLLQSFEIVSKGASNPAVAKLLNEIKLEVETGSPLATAFRKYPLHFDALYSSASPRTRKRSSRSSRRSRRRYSIPSLSSRSPSSSSR
jgi:hypothetical protein